MDCKQAHNLFDAYLDGELSPALETELHAHRLNCPACRQEMEVAGHVIRSGAGEPPLRPEFTDRLLACLEPVVAKPYDRRRWVLRIGFGLAAAACLTIAIVRFSGPANVEPQVAGFVEDNGGLHPLEVPVDRADTDLAGPDLEKAAQALQRALDGAVRDTHQSSTSLRDFGQMTLLEMIDALQIDDRREPDPQDIPTDGVDADEDVDDVEDI